MCFSAIFILKTEIKGTFTQLHFTKKAGYNTRVQSTINGKTNLVSYFHLQKENRVLQSTLLVKVKAGDIIGYQGDSGNLKGAIKSGVIESNVHIEGREHDGSSKWGYKNFNLVDPRTYFSTTIKMMVHQKLILIVIKTRKNEKYIYNLNANSFKFCKMSNKF